MRSPAVGVGWGGRYKWSASLSRDTWLFSHERRQFCGCDVHVPLVRVSGGNSKAISLRGYLLAKAGRLNEARAVLDTLDALSRERYVPPYAMALVHAGLGQREAVFEWLDLAYGAHDIHLIYLPVDPKWDPYRADPRFTALLVRCGFAVS